MNCNSKWFKLWNEAVCQINQYWSGCIWRSFLYFQSKWAFGKEYTHIWEVIQRFSTLLHNLKSKHGRKLKCSSHLNRHISCLLQLNCRISIPTDNLLSFYWLFFWFVPVSSLHEHKFSCLVISFCFFFLCACLSFVFKLEAINHQG